MSVMQKWIQPSSFMIITLLSNTGEDLSQMSWTQISFSLKLNDFRLDKIRKGLVTWFVLYYWDPVEKKKYKRSFYTETRNNKKWVKVCERLLSKQLPTFVAFKVAKSMVSWGSVVKIALHLVKKALWTELLRKYIINRHKGPNDLFKGTVQHFHAPVPCLETNTRGQHLAVDWVLCSMTTSFSFALCK